MPSHLPGAARVEPVQWAAIPMPTYNSGGISEARRPSFGARIWSFERNLRSSITRSTMRSNAAMPKRQRHSLRRTASVSPPICRRLVVKQLCRNFSSPGSIWARGSQATVTARLNLWATGPIWCAPMNPRCGRTTAASKSSAASPYRSSSVMNVVHGKFTEWALPWNLPNKHALH